MDTGFNADPLINYWVRAITIQPDGRILVGGEFQGVGGSAMNFVARLNQNASLDPSFNPGSGPDAPVRCIALQPDGRILLGGSFGRVNGFQSYSVARLDPTGAVDTNFVCGLDNIYISPKALAQQGDGKVLVVSDNGLDRLLPNGAVDPAFQRVSSYQLLTNWDGSVQTANLIFTGVQALSDGRILIGGTFPAIWGSPRGGLVRLQADGSLDASFNAQIYSADAFVITPQTNVIVTGTLANSYGGHQLLRLQADGSLDSSFGPSATLGGDVWGMGLQADGKIIVTGGFREVGGLHRVGIARFNVDGSIDPAMDSGFDDNTEILAAAVQSDQKIVVGGSVNWPGTFITKRLVRLNNDTPGFAGRFEFGQGAFRVAEDALNLVVPVNRNGGTNGTVTVHYATTPGSAVAGRQYTPQSGTLTFPPGQVTNAFSIPIFDDHMVQTQEVFQRFGVQLSNPTGGAVLGSQSSAVVTIGDVDVALQFGALVNSALETDMSGIISVVRLGNPQPAVGVSYSTADGTASAGVDYVTQSGVLLFGSGELAKTIRVPLLADAPTSQVETVLLSLSNPTGGAMLGQLSNATLRIVQPVPGAPDSSFVPATNVFGRGLVVAQGDGKVILEATVSGVNYGGASFVRLNPDGSVDPTFSLTNGLAGQFHCAALQADGKLVVGGSGLSANTISSESVIRLNADGSVDEDFNSMAFPGYVATVSSLAVESDGKILISGDDFDFGTAPANVARLNPDGSVDRSFVADVSGGITRVLLQPDGKVLICGGFTQVGGAPRAGLARLNSDGSLDEGFMPAVALVTAYGWSVPAIVLQTDGKILLSAQIQLTAGSYQLRLLRLDPDGSLDTGFSSDYTSEAGVLSIQAGGKIVVGTYSGAIVRLNADGSLDPGWNAVPGDSGSVSSLAIAADGGLWVAGWFSSINGIPRPGIARLRNDGSSAAGVLDFSVRLVPVLEGVTSNVLLTVRRSVGSNGVVAINYGVGGGTGQAGVNFVHIDGSLTFGDGDTAGKQISLPLLDDGVPGPGQTITLWLANALGGAVLGTPAAATVLVVDNDATIQFATDTVLVNEIAGIAVVTVSRLGRLNESFSVDYATADGSAQAGLDYVAQAGRLGFGPGETNKSITVSIINTVWPEQDEMFFVKLSNPSNPATLGHPFTAAIRIMDNNRPGSLDRNFYVGPSLYVPEWMSGRDLSVDALAVRGDGRVLVGGYFFCAGPGYLPRNGLARLLPNGMVDTHAKRRVHPECQRRRNWRGSARAGRSNGWTDPGRRPVQLRGRQPGRRRGTGQPGRRD